MAPTLDTLKECKKELAELIHDKSCGPILIRLAWHDAGTYDSLIGAASWPDCGGANGSIRFAPEINHAANAGLQNALELLEPIKKMYKTIGYADLFQLASATAVEAMGGPVIPMRYGRKDATDPKMCHKEGNLPAGNAPFPTGKDAAGHLRAVFGRMGLTDEDIVALSGAHTVGRAHRNRSGTNHKDETEYTKATVCPMGTKATGGASWCANWVHFDNEYFKHVVNGKPDKELMWLETDAVLATDPKFKPYTEKFAQDQKAFFEAYKRAYKKLSELGVQWEGEPVSMGPTGLLAQLPQVPTAGVYVAATVAVAVLVKVVLTMCKSD